MRDITTNILLLNINLGGASSYTIPQGYFTSGHQYRIAVSAALGSQTAWYERTFFISSYIQTNLYLFYDYPILSTGMENNIRNTANYASYSFGDTYGINFNIASISGNSTIKNLYDSLQSNTYLCTAWNHHNWQNDSNTPYEMLNDCKHHSSAAYMLWDLYKKSYGSGLISMYTIGLLCKTNANGSHSNDINCIALPPGFGGLARGNESVIGLGGGYWREVRYTAHEWSHNYGTQDSYGTNVGACSVGEPCIMRQDHYNTIGYISNLWCTNCYNTILSNRNIH